MVIEKQRREDDDNLTFERFARALIRAYWHLPQNAKRHKKSILLGLSQYFKSTNNENQNQHEASTQADSASKILCEETRVYFNSFLESVGDVSADSALEHVSLRFPFLSLYAITERCQRKKMSDDSITIIVVVFNAALDENAHLMIRLCKWILDTVMKDIKAGRNVSNVAACTDVATLTQRLLKEFCLNEGGEEERGTLGTERL